MAITRRINIQVAKTSVLGVYTGGGVNYLIETPSGVLYCVFIDAANDPVFTKSLDYGLTWNTPTQLKAITCTQLSVWYDRWTDPTGVLGDKIHVIYTDSGLDDTYYRYIDTSDDSLGTERTPFTGNTTASGGAISISRMRGGNIIIAGSIDAGAEAYCYKTADLGVNWTSIAAVYEASPDKLIMMPGWGADNQDAMCFYYDNSANEISVKYYDDSGDAWSETSIATTITHPDHTSTTLGHWSATVDITNSQNLLAFWTAVDAANADLRVFKVTQSAQTETTSNVVLNSTDDQGFCSIQIDINTEDWYVFYMGSSDGSETYNTGFKIYYKKSTDDGVNWGTETEMTDLFTGLISYFCGVPRFYRIPYLLSWDGYVTQISINTILPIQKTTLQIGI